ncbi:DNA-binding response regulator [Sphingopyxis sp. QXT-31]|uniref:response regulator transcription factor n=1 Tax=Sphingopyxis sp. QXT-31 TaxID=1357916 RepID=UPI0009790C81|nr:response regulator transcription factor [Sphingopyxis sp. QXT-31]APZ97578.1 DNA-binding response regulator [Sphingopyxis sp. QXT-31]
MQILVIEDDARVAEHIGKGLKAAGHVVTQESDGRAGLLRAAADTFDLIIVDRMLPQVDGLTIVRTIRATGDATPILFLSALGEVDERVAGLRAGGDDYLTKPFAMSELLARVDVLARRGPAIVAETRLSVGDLDIDLLGQQVKRQGKPIDLTAREFRILVYLAQNEGRVVTRSMLLEHVWDYHFDPQTNIIDQHVSRLRQKVDKGYDTTLIHTVRGTGYMMRAGG